MLYLPDCMQICAHCFCSCLEDNICAVGFIALMLWVSSHSVLGKVACDPAYHSTGRLLVGKLHPGAAVFLDTMTCVLLYGCR